MTMPRMIRSALLLAVLLAAQPAAAMFTAPLFRDSPSALSVACVAANLPAAGGPLELRFRFRAADGTVREEVRTGVSPVGQTCVSNPFAFLDLEVLRAGAPLCRVRDLRGPIADVTVSAAPGGGARCA